MVCSMAYLEKWRLNVMYGIGLMSITWVVTWNGGYREVPCN